MDPDDARAFIRDLLDAIVERARQLPDSPDRVTPHAAERAKQHYGNDVYQLFAGIEAALMNWDASGKNTEELREEYGGRFVTGVEIGERLAVYEERDFEFTGSSGDGAESSSASEKFTFTQ